MENAFNLFNIGVSVVIPRPESGKNTALLKPLFTGMTLLCATVMLTACSAGHRTYDERPQLVASPDKASMMLAEAADRASVALETLAAVEQTRTPVETVEPVADAPPELRRAMTVTWVGPVEPITKRVADRAGYNFVVLGDSPAAAQVVTVDVENMPVIDILRSIGLQLGARANLKVNAEHDVIEIHYAAQGDPAPVRISE
jgi:defect-in-organelle-trafficking protein DotD